MKLNNFRKNTDYTSEKGVYDFELSLDVPANSGSSRNYYESDKRTIPLEGPFFAIASIQATLWPNITTTGMRFDHTPTSSSAVYTRILNDSDDKYYIRVEVIGEIPAFNVKAKVHLSKSPF